jgi:hypothetical protein
VIRKPLAQIVLQAERVVAEQDGAQALLAPRDEHAAENTFSGGKHNLSVHGATLFASRAARTPVLAAGADFPHPIFFRHADGARAVTRGARRAFVKKEHALPDVAATRDRPQRGRTVEASVNARAAVAA